MMEEVRRAVAEPGGASSRVAHPDEPRAEPRAEPRPEQGGAQSRAAHRAEQPARLVVFSVVGVLRWHAFTSGGVVFDDYYVHIRAMGRLKIHIALLRSSYRTLSYDITFICRPKDMNV